MRAIGDLQFSCFKPTPQTVYGFPYCNIAAPKVKVAIQDETKVYTYQS
ncbi:MAG TPA: hypothetical protein V6D18_16765 [Thermosynechococcaceae cyanobacterium]